ncbi:hypothetical protein D3C72_2281660 [compost metagenome]
MHHFAQDVIDNFIVVQRVDDSSVDRCQHADSLALNRNDFIPDDLQDFGDNHLTLAAENFKPRLLCSKMRMVNNEQ